MADFLRLLAIDDDHNLHGQVGDGLEPKGFLLKIASDEAGTDDYISKLFEPREGLAGTTKVSRRALALPPKLAPKPGIRLRFAGCRIDLQARHLVDHRGIEVSLSGAEFRILLILLDHHAEVLSRDQLSCLMKGRVAAPFDRSIDMLVSRLRQKLDDDAKSPQIIMTVRSKGYVIVAPHLVKNE